MKWRLLQGRLARQTLALAAALPLLWSAFFLFYTDGEAKKSAFEENRLTVERQVAAIRAAQRQESEEGDEISAIKRLSRVEKYFFAGGSADLLRRFSEASSKAGVELQSVAPQKAGAAAEEEADFTVCEVELCGTFANILHFVGQIENEPPFSVVQRLEIQRPPQENGALSARMEIAVLEKEKNLQK